MFDSLSISFLVCSKFCHQIFEDVLHLFLRGGGYSRVADSALLLRIRGAFCSTYSQNKPFPPFRQQKYPLSSIFLTIKTSEGSYHVKNREKTINTDNTRQYLHETTIPSKHFFSHNTSKEPVLVKIFLETHHYASS